MSDETTEIIKATTFGTTEGGTWEQVSSSPLLKAGDGAHTQLEAEEDQFFTAVGNEIVPPPIDPKIWAATYNLSTRLARAITTMARNIVGLGWLIAPDEDFDLERASDAEKKQFEEERNLLRKLFKKPCQSAAGHPISFTELMFRIITDRESTGNGWLEVVRNAVGVIVGLNHAPTKSMRIRKGGKGFIQVHSQRKKYFKMFGDERVINAKTGEESEGAEIPFEDQATEIIQFPIYNPTSMLYGMPRYVAAAPAISGNRLSAIRNVVFFENDAVPRLAITVSGGKLAASSFEMIERFLTVKGKGTANAHRVMLLQAEDRDIGMPGNSGQVSVKITPLTVGTQDDASFLKYTEANNEEIREAFGITEVFFKTMDVNRAAGIIGRKVTNEQVFQPEKRNVEFSLNSTVVADLLQDTELDIAGLRFKDPAPMDTLESAEAFKLLTESWAVIPNEVRKELGMAPYPKELLVGDVPVGLTELLIKSKLVGNPAQEAFSEAGPPVADAAPEQPSGDPEGEGDQEDVVERARGMAGLIEKLFKDAGVDVDICVGKPEAPVSFGEGKAA